MTKDFEKRTKSRHFDDKERFKRSIVDDDIDHQITDDPEMDHGFPDINTNPAIVDDSFTNEEISAAPAELADSNLPKPHECGLSTASSRKITGGKVAVPGDWPWMAWLSIETDNSTVLCGGTLISDSHVLTAGHCFENFGYFNKIQPKWLKPFREKNIFSYRCSDYVRAFPLNLLAWS